MFSKNELITIYAIFKNRVNEMQSVVGSFSDPVNKIYEKDIVQYQEIVDKALELLKG
jgi:hypothetical protein